MSVQQEKFKEIADNIRVKLGTDDLIKPSEFADKVNEVYNKGYSESESDFWKSIVYDTGTRSNVEYMFHRWRCEYIRPPFKVMGKTRNINMFSYNTKLKKVEKAYFDISGFTPNTSGTATDSNYYTFYYCQELEEIEDIGMQGGGYYFTFNSCPKLHTIEVMRCVKNGTYSTPFTNCNALKNLTIEGEIGKSFPIPNSPLSTASIVSIIEHLSQDVTGQTLTLNKTAKNNMVYPYTSPYSQTTYNSWDDVINNPVVKNWTISLSS